MSKSKFNLEVIWSIVATILVAISCYVSGAGAFISALSIVGILFVLGVAFKRPESQLLGAGFVGMLAYASYTAGFFANAAVNGIVLVPLSIWGYFHWKRGKQSKNLVKKLSRKNLILYITTIFSSVILLLLFTINAGGNLPILDALTGVLPVASTLLMVGGYREQWLLWIPYNALQALMWFSAASLQPAMLAVFVLKLVFLLNSIIGAYNWNKGA